MVETKRDVDPLNVFISYSRDDLTFADQLDAALDGTGFNAVIDRHGISGADEWKRRLAELIRDTDTVVFVLSQSSALSKICTWEVEEADRLGKRIIPVLCKPLDGAAPPVRLAELNYIYFYDEPKVPGSGFGSGLAKLIGALNEDPVWLRENTRLLGLASQWLAAGRPANRLLSGDDISRARAWLTEQRKTKTLPTAQHLEFIRASEDEAGARLSEERRQLEEREQLVREADLAVREKQAAQQREAEASNRVVRRTLAGMVGAIALATVASGAGWWALQLKDEAELQRQAAIVQKTEAEAHEARAGQAAIAASAAKAEAIAQQREAQIRRLEAEAQRRAAEEQRLRLCSATM